MFDALHMYKFLEDENQKVTRFWVWCVCNDSAHSLSFEFTRPKIWP